MSRKKFPFSYPFLFILAFFGLLLIPLRTLNLNPNTLENDFYGRGRLITLVSNFRVRMGDRVFPKVLVGKDHWLMLTADNSMYDFQKSISFTEEELSSIQDNLETLNDRFAGQRISLLVVIVPNKSTMYPENMPEEIPILGTESRLDQLMDYMNTHGPDVILDLRPLLFEAKREQQIYYATDTHWNDYGAFLAYQKIIEVLSQEHPELITKTLEDYRLKRSEPERLDLGRNIGTSLLDEQRVSLIPKFDTYAVYKDLVLGGRRMMFSYVPKPELPTAVIYYDSFFFPVIPFLGEHFQRGIFIQNYTSGGLWNLSWVEEEKPDIVIVEFAERYIQDIPRLLKP